MCIDREGKMEYMNASGRVGCDDLLFRPEAGSGVGDLDVEDLGAANEAKSQHKLNIVDPVK
jgi:hypothetical protein